jgi:pimeloyl-ACP methyl ester carboxylesterase
MGASPVTQTCIIGNTVRSHPISRRAVLGALALPLAPQVFGQKSAPQPFRVAIPQPTIDRILSRVRDARWPDRLDGAWQYGASWDYMKGLAGYWATRYDWRKQEARLNAYPQFLARVEDYEIHFYHVRGRGPRPVPVIFTHGWPGSVVEYLDAIGPLSDPARFGGQAEDAFDVIVPSLPGFGFSSKPKGKPVGPATVARLWRKLMTEVLGYARFGAQGGDWGQAVTIQLAAQFPTSMMAIHLSNVAARPIPDSEQNDEERAWVRASAAFRAAEMDYFNEQQHKPQTVAFALTDNPLGAAAWIIEKLKGWSDSGDDLDQTLTKDQVLNNVMLYLVSNTVGSAVWIYRGNADDPAAPRARIEVPTGVAAFPREMTALAPPRSLIERDFNLIQYTKMPRGGHFGCFEQPQLFVEDVRNFFRKVRG